MHAEDLQLTSYEQTIAMEVVVPEEIPVSFDGMRALSFFDSEHVWRAGCDMGLEDSEC